MTSIEELEGIANSYHNVSNAIPDIHIENLCQRYFIDWLLGLLPEKANVLELGYGDGLVTAALSSVVNELTVVEGAESLAKRARQLHPTVQCVHGLFEDYTPNSFYDVIIASHVLEHVDEPLSILRRMHGWLRRAGKVVIVVPNCNSIHRQLAVLMGLQPALDSLSKRDLLVGHQRVYSLSLLKQHIENADLRIVESRGFFLKVLPNSMMLDYSADLLWALNKISSSLPEELLANIAVVAEKNEDPARP